MEEPEEFGDDYWEGLFADEEPLTAPSCDLENPESCESCT